MPGPESEALTRDRPVDPRLKAAGWRVVPYRDEFEPAVREGFLVDYNVVNIRSDVRLQGLFLREGEEVEMVDPESGSPQRDRLEDERECTSPDVERKVTSPDSNRKILQEIKKYAVEHEREYGRFPKTLIFAQNYLPNVSHADRLVEMAQQIFGRGDAFVEIITGRVDRMLAGLSKNKLDAPIGILRVMIVQSTRRRILYERLGKAWRSHRSRREA